MIFEALRMPLLSLHTEVRKSVDLSGKGKTIPP